MSTTATVRMEEHEKRALTEFAEFNGMTFSEWARKTLCEAYEDFMDVQIALEAIEEHEGNPVSYTLDEVIRMNGDEDLLGDD